MRLSRPGGVIDIGECIPAMAVLKSNVVSQVIRTTVFIRGSIEYQDSEGSRKKSYENAARSWGCERGTGREAIPGQSHLFRL